MFAVGRSITGRFARRLYAVLLLSLILLSAGARIRSALMARRIHAVLAGLEQVRIDQTNEAELLKTVPYLIRNESEWHIGTSVARSYRVVISNEDDLKWLGRTPGFRLFASSAWGVWSLTAFDKLGYWFGYRYLSFAAGVVVLDGKVSSVWYGIAPQSVFPRAVGNILSVKSVHGFWEPYNMPIRVSSLDDESPQYRVRGDERSLSVIYTYDAPRGLTSNAFQVDLSCFWGLRGCLSAREMAPLLWQDKDAIEAATVSRLKSRTPCPDRVLAGRVRYLPDLNVELLEVANWRRENVNEEGGSGKQYITN